MKLEFSTGTTIDLSIDNSPVGTMYQKIYKNLSRAPLPFNVWDNPYYLSNTTYQELVNRLTVHAEKLSIQIDQSLCLLRDQPYFNAIHKIYEKNYNGNRDWLDFHEHIHMCEKYYDDKQYPKILHIDYREKSGPLQKPFDLTWLDTATTKIKAGDVFVRWSELGKTPYNYWENNEPNDIARMCELAKPWLILKPKIIIALEDFDTLKNKKILEFESWWQQYSKPWCQRWNIPSWSATDIFSFLVFGKVSTVDVKLIVEQLKNNINPTKILLE